MNSVPLIANEEVALRKHSQVPPPSNIVLTPLDRQHERVRVCLRAESSETNSSDTFHLQIALPLPLVQWGGTAGMWASHLEK